MNQVYSGSPVRRNSVVKAALILTAIAASFGFAPNVTANPLQLAQSEPAPSVNSAPEVDTSVTRDYESAIVYMPDPQTLRLVPHSVLLTADAPVEGAVDQIVQSYEGQDMGITSYEVDVDPVQHEAEIDFSIEHPRGADVLQSMSSANQYAMIEAIRETLLTQPDYEIEEVIFMANGEAIDI